MFGRKKETINPLTFNDYYFDELGVSRREVMRLFTQIVEKIQLNTKDADCMFRPAWCALKLSGVEPKNILELGTYKGYSAVFLATLWTDARVYTVDLPADDPLFYKWQPEPTNQSPLLYELPNITTIKENTMCLPQTVISTIDFDLIFIDAGHTNPSMSFDHLYSWNKLKLGGWLFSDDVMPPFDTVNGKGNVIWETIKYLNDRSKDKFRFLLQREDPARFKSDGKRGKRKYVAFVNKKNRGSKME